MMSKLTMIVEQTKEYKKRMIYNPETGIFTPSDADSLMSVRNFDYPYGWIKETGTPPDPHCDCILMADKPYALGDEVTVKIIGMFKRNDGDHKYIVVESERATDDYRDLETAEKEALSRLYPHVREGEGWFGKEEARYCFLTCERAL